LRIDMIYAKTELEALKIANEQNEEVKKLLERLIGVMERKL